MKKDKESRMDEGKQIDKGVMKKERAREREREGGMKNSRQRDRRDKVTKRDRDKGQPIFHCMCMDFPSAVHQDNRQSHDNLFMSTFTCFSLRKAGLQTGSKPCALAVLSGYTAKHLSGSGGPHV